ncbi:MAG: hypothetical protein ABL951_10420 [Alphaproteobacteria bacterium]
MPTEVKSIIFSNEELMNAINLFESANIPKLSDGRILSVSINPDEKENICILFLNFNKDQERKILISIPNFGAILLNFCLKYKIPMARKATKKIKIVGDNVSLEFVLGHEQIPIRTTV